MTKQRVISQAKKLSNDKTIVIEPVKNDDKNDDSNITDLTDQPIISESLPDLAHIPPPQANTNLTVAKPSIFNIEAKEYKDMGIGALALVLEQMSKNPNTGIGDIGIGLMKYQKAKELGLPWANASSHMSVIKGKVGLEYQLVEAILCKPKSGVTWRTTEDFVPLYDYMDSNGMIYSVNELPPNAVICNSLKDQIEPGKIAVILAPTFVKVGNVNVPKILPVDWRTTVQMTRKKKDIDDEWITETITASYTWRDALREGLPYGKDGALNYDSIWFKRKEFMIWKSAFWKAAKRIANDLILGAYDIDDLNSFADTIK